jgi:DNA-directed RNA polymerase specialized sigma24 family protein
LVASDIYSIADHAVSVVMRRGNSWWPPDREDARQEAALAILLASRRGLDKDRGYYFGAARNGVCMWIRAWLRPSRDTFPLLARVEELVAAKTSMADAMLRNLDSLAPLLRGQEVKRRKIAEAEIAVEVEYCRLMLEGYTIDEAGAILGRTRRNTHALRERVVPKLRRIAEGTRHEARYAKPGPTSIAALQKLAQDPEALRRRNQAISAAKRQRPCIDSSPCQIHGDKP